MSETNVRMDVLSRFDHPYVAGDSTKTFSSIADVRQLLLDNRTEQTPGTMPFYQESDDVPLFAGRVILKRNAGRIVFATIRSLDRDDAIIQLFLAPQNMDAQSIQDFKETVHLGDIIHVNGIPGYSNTNELSIFVTGWTMAAKSLNTFPKAIPNPETGELEHQLNGATVHDQPVLHLLTSAQHRANMRTRSQVIRALRDFYHDHGFMEVDTPILSTHAGGATATRFSTHSAARDEDMFLRIAPELYLKRLVIGGMGNVFELGKNFRNEGIDATHSPEFMALESYQLNSDYKEQARMMTQIINTVWGDQDGNPLTYVRHALFFDSLNEALAPYGQFLSPSSPVEDILRAAADCDVELTPSTPGHMMEELFDRMVVDRLGQGAIFFYDYPTETTPLAYANGDGTSQKWDLYVNGMELATAYTENTDPLIQELTLTEDQDFVNDVRYGMPPMGGMGIGVDRLVMLVAGASHINHVNHHPHSAV